MLPIILHIRYVNYTNTHSMSNSALSKNNAWYNVIKFDFCYFFIRAKKKTTVQTVYDAHARDDKTGARLP